MDWIEILGFVAATLTTVAFVPQALKTIKTKHTKDLSMNMYIALNIGVLLWFIYGLAHQKAPIIAANLITFGFTFTILVMIIKYRDKG